MLRVACCTFMSEREKTCLLAIQNAPSEDSDQTARMRSLIRIFAGCTCPEVRFLTLRIIYTTVLHNSFVFHSFLSLSNLNSSNTGGSFTMADSN